MKYKNGKAPYDLPYSAEFMNATLWWQTTEDSIGIELKSLAVKLLSVTPHSAACERSFSILTWIHPKARNRLMVKRLEAIAKIYMYNISHQEQHEHKELSQSISTVDNSDINWESDDGEEIEETGKAQMDLFVCNGLLFSFIYVCVLI